MKKAFLTLYPVFLAGLAILIFNFLDSKNFNFYIFQHRVLVLIICIILFITSIVNVISSYEMNFSIGLILNSIAIVVSLILPILLLLGIIFQLH
ncbi:hypothetical protein [Tenacibaculum jejuense]|uniref:Uncharacterized protein n=1 Tax=Tenacibaculum jejuense TaxID=584609 RepID=A0A238UD74_9FLAO|nr:hypothetical protein [Tenacibaculum jejuense]SNR16434.1 Hypothetical membrane protein of unknown function [Tenacibaculum jejuense]